MAACPRPVRERRQPTKGGGPPSMSNDDLSEDELMASMRRLPELRFDHAASEGDTMRLVEQLRIHQTELEMQNQELRETQRQLEASRSRYSDLYDFAPVGYCTLD